MSEHCTLRDKIREAEEQELTAHVLQLCNEFLERYPDEGPVWVRRGIALVELARYEEAWEVFERALQLCPPERAQIVLSQFGHLEEARGNLLEARVWFEKAHAADPDDATYLIFIGHTYFKAGDLTQAEEFHRKATGCPDGYIEEAHFNLGGTLLAQERFDEAQECYLKALEIDPEYDKAKKRLQDVRAVLKHDR